jgi:hypothetical protein
VSYSIEMDFALEPMTSYHVLFEILSCIKIPSSSWMGKSNHHLWERQKLSNPYSFPLFPPNQRHGWHTRIGFQTCGHLVMLLDFDHSGDTRMYLPILQSRESDPANVLQWKTSC